ncbi:glycerophosphoryl diester phosphodiesterase [Bacillus pakistanensis]|uniref:Glycerophosphoryl diester phosphodiesterase n=1 Tax=Rossellomorea pakistanensis TaxID=992288 RepID=A0ABS2NBB1_9BACI|nr:glycerophosphodiester phosphodiesterase [Bacillus pakistanensis]MBM7585128.1 glycerophosphoryl diester phosphodiesterase [Bacillus pakistanensis]
MIKGLFRNVFMSAALVGIGGGVVGQAEAAEPIHPSLNPNKILNVAHRGASGHAPEHTLLAYELGEQMKGDYIEVDLQMTKDGELIAMHDEKLDRTTNGTGLVKDHTLAEIKQLDAGSWFNEKYPDYANEEYVGLQVPTLEEVIQKFGKDARYYIETKSPHVYPGMEQKLLEILEEYKLTGPNASSSKVIIQSFSSESLKMVHALNPTVPLVQLISYKGSASITDEQLVEYKTYSIGLGMSYKTIDEAYVQKVREHGLLIHPYTVNEKEDMRRLLDWGVTGMFTNFPDRLQEVMKEKNKRLRD